MWSSTPVTITLSQSLFHSNGYKWDTRANDLQADVAERTYLEAREAIAMNTVNAFFDLFAARMGLKNADANVRVNDTLYTINKGRFHVGKIGQNDLFQHDLLLILALA